jgi:hypothetical protein
VVRETVTNRPWRPLETVEVVVVGDIVHPCRLHGFRSRIAPAVAPECRGRASIPDQLIGAIDIDVIVGSSGTTSALSVPLTLTLGMSGAALVYMP